MRMKMMKSLLLGLWLCLIHSNVNATQQSILMLTGSHANKAKITLLQTAAFDKGLSLQHQTAKSLQHNDNLVRHFEQYQLVIFAGVSARESRKAFAEYAGAVGAANSRFMSLKAVDDIALLKGMTQDEVENIRQYFANGGRKNLTRMVDYISVNLFDQSGLTVEPPIVYPAAGIYHPQHANGIFNDLPTYLQWSQHAGEPVVGIMFDRASIESDTTGLVDETIARLQKKGLFVVPFFSQTSRQGVDYAHLVQIEGQTFIDLIVNMRNIHFASQRKAEFERWGVPVMQALTYYDGNQQHWEQSSQGITPGMSPFQLVLPESAGVIDPIIIAAYNKDTGLAEVIDYQLQHLVDKATKVVALKHKANGDKKLTVMVWGNRDVGASFMNIPASLGAIAARLNQADYQIPSVKSDYFTSRIDRILNPFYRSYELEPLIKDDLAELMPVNDYLSWFNSLPAKVREPINSYWGQAKDNFMVINRDGQAYFVLPRVRLGNMLVMRQPPRADNNEEDQRIYHKGTIPMNHYYLAAYYYARKYWGSDAIVHLGTHGSHEYLPGKERGLSVYDQGNLA
ncbi:MAG: cobaltochelatase subunit CobN, partial [Psychrosphaera sp.]|nr:cobaltochelatase subunit CobN [Psychrosphaera sp.]